jgi:hypothetical protein
MTRTLEDVMELRRSIRMRAQIGRSLHTMASSSGFADLASAFSQLADTSRRFIAALDNRSAKP